MSELNCQCEGCDLRDLFFSHVSEVALARICDIRIERNYPPGTSIISEGDEVRDFMYLKEGLVKLFREIPGNRSQIIAIGKPLDFVSLISVFSETKYRYSVTALEPSTTCVLDIDFVKKMALENGAFALDLMQKMSRASDEIVMNSMEIRKRQLKGRIAYLLLFFSNEIYRSDSFELPISRKEMADYIGMTTENVIRALSEFRKDHLMNIYGKQIQILDLDRLGLISAHG